LRASEPAIDALAETITRHPRGIIVCGPDGQPGLGQAVSALAAAASYPILADPLSGVRFGPHDRSAVLDAYDPVLRVTPRLDTISPDVVIRIGAIPTSKPLQQLLAAQPARGHVLIDPGDPRDPSHLATQHLAADPPSTLRRLAERTRTKHAAPASTWMAQWIDADRVASAAVADALAAFETPFEGRAVAEVAALLPDGATLVVGNSMPIRDVDAFVRGDRRHVRIVANRGANGIDGVVSSALGAAAVSGEPVVLLIGDLSFVHDLSGLLAASRAGLDATIVVLNNDGGGIFSFLPQAELLDPATFETLFGTPIGLDIAAVALLCKASYARPETWPAFRQELCCAMATPGLSVLEHVTDRRENVTQHRQVWAAVEQALARTSWGHA
jgi:2-succinyl-5-enolpyruvyl-6-hydroxy-3-cyclohexene-1-carboxylate synthase